ncbi:hypothetical protein [uncultured Desulfovibrio sp.]|uniref:hypothetical protein n=1 Tax=uncultured Desulfovibrio sp. TaxID=167968 RepID=UPI0003AA3705|nr:hypothetical protein [uncultured Desulfovibrio sp.]
MEFVSHDQTAKIVRPGHKRSTFQRRRTGAQAGSRPVRAERGDQICPAKWKPGAAALKPGLDLVGKL